MPKPTAASCAHKHTKPQGSEHKYTANLAIFATATSKLAHYLTAFGEKPTHTL